MGIVKNNLWNYTFIAGELLNGVWESIDIVELVLMVDLKKCKPYKSKTKSPLQFNPSH